MIMTRHGEKGVQGAFITCEWEESLRMVYICPHNMGGGVEIAIFFYKKTQTKINIETNIDINKKLYK
jgi:hypothetical protein